jgi:hypothetical protein
VRSYRTNATSAEPVGSIARTARNPTFACSTSARAETLRSASARSASSFLVRASSRIDRGTGSSPLMLRIIRLAKRSRAAVAAAFKDATTGSPL